MKPGFAKKSLFKKVGFLLSLFLSLNIASCGSSGSSKGPTPETVPVLKNLAVLFAAYDAETNKAGDFLFEANQNKIFLGFGPAPSGESPLPTFEYYLDPDAQIQSPTEGIVTAVNYQAENDDYSIIIRPEADSNWFVNIDHVLNVQVAVNETVEVGDVLGNPGTWELGLGRTELMIGNEETDLAYCPFEMFDSDLSATYQNQVTQLLNDWEAFKNDDTIYDQSSMVYPGCYSTSMSAG